MSKRGTGALAVHDGILYRGCGYAVERTQLATQKPIKRIWIGWEPRMLSIVGTTLFVACDGADVAGYSLPSAKRQTHDLNAYGAAVFVGAVGGKVYYASEHGYVTLATGKKSYRELFSTRTSLERCALHGKTLATCSRKQTSVTLWSLATARLQRRLRAGRTTALAANAGHIYAVADGELLSWSPPKYPRKSHGTVGAATSLLATPTHVYAAGPDGVFALDATRDTLSRLTAAPGLGLAADDHTLYVETGSHVASYPRHASPSKPKRAPGR